MLPNTIKTTDKTKVARVIADMLSVENADKLSPEQAINNGLRSIKNKRMTPELVSVLKKMLGLANEVGIKVDHALISSVMKEETLNETWVSQKSHPDGPGKGQYLGDLNNDEHKESIKYHEKAIKSKGTKSEKANHIRTKMHHEDALRSWSRRNIKEGAIEVDSGSVMNGGVDVVAPITSSGTSSEKRLRFKDHVKKKTAVHMDNYEDDQYTKVGSSLDNDKLEDDDHLRRRKVAYKMDEETEIDDITDEDLDKLADEIEDEEDILDVYDEDELVIIDTETGEEEKVEELDEQALLEVLSRVERMRAKFRLIRTKSKRQRRLQIALKKRSDTKTLMRRARKLAIKLLKKRLLKKDPTKLTIAEKERVEKMIAGRKKAIDRLAMRLLSKVRKIENDRLSHNKSN